MAESSSKCSCNEQERQHRCFGGADRPVGTLLIQLLLLRTAEPVSWALVSGHPLMVSAISILCNSGVFAYKL